MKKTSYSWTLLLCLLFSSNQLFAQTDHTVGTGTSTNGIYEYPCPFPDGYESTRQQFLFLASELTSAGMSAGTITALKWTVISLGSAGANEEYTIKIGTTTSSTLSASGWETGLSTVYGPITYTPVAGVNTILLSAPFYWNGTSNLVVEVCHGDPTATSSSVNSYSENPEIAYSTVSGFNASRLYADDDQGNACSYSGTGVGGFFVTQNPTWRPNTTFTLLAGPPPSCPQPAGLSAGSITATGATLSWNAVTGASGYEWFVNTSATPPATGTPITATTTPSGTLTPGTTYYFHVRANCGANGYSAWSTVAFSTPYGNDNAVDAITLTVGTACSGTPNGNQSGATVETNEPTITCGLINNNYTSVWYKFVAPASGMVRISTDYNNIPGGMDDTKIGVYQVSNPADFNTYQIIGCDDDNGAVEDYNSIVYLAGLTPSVTYYIKVDKYSAGTTSGPFCIDVMPITPAMIASAPNCLPNAEFENVNPNGGTAWVSLVDDGSGKLVANLRANGNSVDEVYTNFYQHTTNPVRSHNGQPYLDRNYAVEVDVQPTTPVDVQFFFQDADFNALAAAVPGLTMAGLNVTRLTSAACATTYNPASQTVSYLPQVGNGSSGGVRYVQVQTPGFSGFFIHANIYPLAIDLKNVTAANFGEHNRVDWNTASEQKGDIFEIERSLDGENFTTIGTLSAKGTASEYTYWDKQPAAGINYYRLRMTDAAGGFSYSAVVQASVKNSDRFFVEAFPNPVKDVVTIKTFGAGEVSSASIVIADITGKPVRELRLTGNQAEISITDLAPGLYFIKYKDSLHDQTIRISKQ